MRHPFWILNSALLALILVALLFALFSRQEVPEAESIKPDLRAIPVKKEVSKINISKIYEDDIFGTYQKELVKPKEPAFVAPLPEPPAPAPMMVPEPPKPQFLDPLQITLKGIMSTGDDTSNVAIILDNKTKRETSYKVGDKIEDAQLIRIFNNKIVFVRSNGQQEVFYLRTQDAQMDPSFATTDDWKEVIKKISPNNYLINVATVGVKIKDLAQFIDYLDLTTAYQKGSSIGVRVGAAENHGLAQALGMQVGDLITSIDEIPMTSTENRIKAYKKIMAMHENDVIQVVLQRGPQKFILNYKLFDFSEYAEPKPGATSMEQEHKIREEQRAVLEKKHTFAPTLKDIKKRERETMLQKGGTPPATPAKTVE